MSVHDAFAESLFETQSKKYQHSVEKCKSNVSVLQVIHRCFFILS